MDASLCVPLWRVGDDILDAFVTGEQRRQQNTVIAAVREPHGSYNRILLSALLSGDKRIEDIVTYAPEWYAQRGIHLHSADPIVHIDRARRRVRSRSGVELTYDRLL